MKRQGSIQKKKTGDKLTQETCLMKGYDEAE